MQIRIGGFQDLALSLTVALATDPAVRRGDVEADVRAALVHAFGKPARRFGEALHRSQVLATVQGILGVDAAMLTGFTAPGVAEDEHGRLPCPGPAFTGSVFQPARLLSVSPEAVQFAELTP